MIKVDAHFFVGPATEPTIAASLRDVKLGRLEPRLVIGGLGAAIAHYAGAPSPPLIVAEVEEGLEQPGQLLAAIAAFSEVCDVGSNLILLGTANDIDLYRALRREGVADYVRLPLDHAQFRDALLDVVAGEAGRPRGQCVAVIGAKGGCGSSTLAHNLAYQLSRGSAGDAMLIDLDLSFGVADLGLALDPSDGARAVLREAGPLDQTALERFSIPYDGRLRLLSAPCSLDNDGRIDPERLELVLDALRQHYRWGILDLPHAWTGWMQRALRHADAVVVVSPIDLGAVRNCRNLLDWLDRERPGSPAPIVALSERGDRKGAITAKDFCGSLGIKDPVLLPDDRAAVLAALSAGKMLPEVAAKSPLVAGLRRIAGQLATAPAGAAAAEGASLLARWLPRLAAGRR